MKLQYFAYIFSASVISYLLAKLVSLWLEHLEDVGHGKAAKMLEYVIMYPLYFCGIFGLLTVGAVESLYATRNYKRRVADLRRARQLEDLRHCSSTEERRQLLKQLGCENPTDTDLDIHSWIRNENEKLGL